MKPYFILLIAVLLFGCASEQETQIREIVTHKNLWLSSGYNNNYSYDIVINSASTSEPLKYSVKVVSGESSLVNYPEIATIEAIFNYTFEAIKSTEKTVTVKYSNTLGFPLLVTVSNPNIIDSTSTIKVTNLRQCKSNKCSLHRPSKKTLGLDLASLGRC
jgi:hypothetical protein